MPFTLRARAAGCLLASALVTPVAQAAPHRASLRGGVGLPNLATGRAELRLAEPLYLVLGGGLGPGVPEAELGLWLRPESSCWGCSGANALSLGFGLSGFAYFGAGLGEGMAAFGFEPTWMHRFGQGPWMTLGPRLGLGLAFSAQGGRPEAALDLTLAQLGLAF